MAGLLLQMDEPRLLGQLANRADVSGAATRLVRHEVRFGYTGYAARVIMRDHLIPLGYCMKYKDGDFIAQLE